MAPLIFGSIAFLHNYTDSTNVGVFAHALCWHRDRLFFQIVAVLRDEISLEGKKYDHFLRLK